MPTYSVIRRSLLTFLFSVTLIVSAAVHLKAQAVVDSDGNELRIGSLYQIHHVGIGFFGGLTTLAPLANKSACTRYVGLGMETDPGLPTSFMPGRPNAADAAGVLRVNVRSSVAFNLPSPTRCADSGVWTADQANSSETGGFTAIVAGRKRGSPATQSWFEVRATDKKGVYTLAHCRCLPCRNICPEVGAHNVGGRTVLGVGGMPFRVQFWKYMPPATLTGQP